MPATATMIGALMGLGTQVYSNALRKLPLMRHPWEHVLGMGLGAIFANQLVKWDAQLQEDLDKMLEKAKAANERRYFEQWCLLSGVLVEEQLGFLQIARTQKVRKDAFGRKFVLLRMDDSGGMSHFGVDNLNNSNYRCLGALYECLIFKGKIYGIFLLKMIPRFQPTHRSMLM